MPVTETSIDADRLFILNAAAFLRIGRQRRALLVLAKPTVTLTLADLSPAVRGCLGREYVTLNRPPSHGTASLEIRMLDASDGETRDTLTLSTTRQTSKGSNANITYSLQHLAATNS
jgi:hypothetical protein